MSEHSPGPWTWNGKFHEYWYAPLKAASGAFIGYYFRASHDTSKLTDEEAHANARLMAAAPDLLEAANDAQAVMDAAAGQLSTDEWIDPKEMLAVAEQLAEYAAKLRSAIAKATVEEA